MIESERINELLARARACELELELCQKRIDFLSTMAYTLLNDGDIQYVDMILITRPKNGARPVTVPLFPIASSEHMLEYLANDTPIPASTKQIGFQRFFDPVELQDEAVLNLEIPLEAPLTMALVDVALVRLKQRKQALLLDIDEIFKK